MNLLETLFKSGKLAKIDYDRYRALPDNASVEQALLADHKVSDDELVEAYGAALQLPVAAVDELRIPWRVFRQLSQGEIERLHAIPYDATARTLKLALSEPGWLKTTQQGQLKINGQPHTALALTTRARYQQVLAWATIPEVTLPTSPIPTEIINRFPRTVAERHRALAYAVSGHTVKLATDEPLNPELWQLKAFIEDKNQMTVELGRVSTEAFEAALAQYGTPETPSSPVVDQASSLPTTPAPTAVAPRIASSGRLTIDRVEPAGKNESRTPAAPVMAPVVTAVHPSLTPQVMTPSSSSVSPATVPTTVNPQSDNDLGALLPQPVKTPAELQAIVTEGFIPKIVAAMVSYGIANRASDVHLEAGRDNLRLRYRIDGLLREALTAPASLHPPIISRIKILAKMKIDETRIPQDGRFDVLLGDKQVDLRISSLPTVYGEKIVMRLLDKSGGIKDIDKLGIAGRGMELLLAASQKPNGIILVTGPTGSGKSTTLYALLNRVSTESVNIITLEDPVEYELKGVNQVQVKPKIGFTFAEGLRSVLRQDPNIIMVGEIRDAETASLATHAALTGHLVLSTLHTNSAAGALPRLMNMGIEPFLLTSAMNIVVAQRLVRKLCEQCRKKATLPPEVVTQVETELKKIPATSVDHQRIGPLVFYQPGSCSACSDGFVGRLGIYEVMDVSEAIESAAVAKKPANDLETIAHNEGMISMRQDGFIKALQGLTTIDEVLRETGKE